MDLSDAKSRSLRKNSWGYNGGCSASACDMYRMIVRIIKLECSVCSIGAVSFYMNKGVLIFLYNLILVLFLFNYLVESFLLLSTLEK